MKREIYLKKVRPFYDKDLIKVFTGVRRAGKSVILTQIMEELENNYKIDKKQIIYINFEFMEFSFIKTADDLYKYINSKIENKKKYYLFLDEIQSVDEWEKVVNSFKAKEKYDIYITGSNSDLLSGELATLLAGRYITFKVYPFSFSEVCELKKITNTADAKEIFNDYILWGGMPQRFDLSSLEQVKIYLQDIYNSIVVKDIISRFEIKDLDLFNRVVEYIVTTPSQTFSAENLSNYFLGKEERNVAKNTLYNYLEYMALANLINKVQRYDIRGKRILSGKYKYYLTDLGLGQIKNVNKKQQIGSYLENIVYNELSIRGYDVSVGNIENGEIDFIATRFEERIYIQVCYLLADENTIKREFGVFDNIKDNYPKYVLSMDEFDMSQNGIIHKNIIDWLLEKKS